MISQSYNLEQFVEYVKGKDFFDIIYFADSEATEAERHAFRLKRTEDSRLEQCEKYVFDLKNLINLLRYEVKPAGITDECFNLYRLNFKEVYRRFISV